MAEHKKLSMLVKLDDGQTYTLGGDGADNAVTLDTEQTITGLKTFDKLPQSSVEPKADADLITKGYADGHYLPVDTKPHKYDILVKMKHDGTSWVGFSDFSVRLRDGTRLDIKHIENQSATTATQPVKAVFKTVKDLKANIESPTQQPATFFDSYSLEAGEFTGTVSFYKAAGKFNPASRDINPWYVYVGSGNANNYDGIYAVSIDNLDKPLLGVNFKFGDAHNSDTYTCTQCGVVFTVDGSALEVAYDGDMSNAFETTIEYPINAQSMIGVVKVDNAQEITGAKTFTQNIKVTAKPKEATDVATVGYVSGLLNAKAPYDVTLDFKVEDDTDGGWVVYSNMEINLDNGKKLKCIHIDNTQPTSANAPVKAVFKAIPATEVINAAPTEQAPTFFDTYQLQDEEYLGTLTYGHILNSQLQDYADYKGPFHTNQYGTTCTIKEATQLRISISELPAAVSKVSLQFSSSYLPKTFKASLSGVGMDVTSNVLTNPSGNTPLELLFDVVKLTGLVTLDTAQTITGAKTFEKLPKSEATPKDDADLITKAYLDERCPIPKSELTLKGSLMQYSYHPDRWIVYQDLRFTLANGQHLVPLYIEDTTVDQIKGPIKVVYKFSDVEYVKNAVVKKTKDFLENYQLKDNELFGQIYHASLLAEDAGPHYGNDYVKPFDEIYVGVNAHDYNLRPLIKFSFEKLSTSLAQVKLSCSGSYAPKQFQLEWEHENKKFVSKLYTFGQDEFLGTAPLEVQIVTAGTGAAPANMVTTDTAQNITEVKTFDKLPKSSVEPTDDTELVNKKYVDDASKKVVTLADAQTISGVKTFSALPQSSVEPATDTDLVNKKYVDAKVGGGGAAGGNVMTLDTEQTVTAVKQFDKFPRLSDNYAYILPTDPKEFVNKAYVDNATTVNNGYALNIYGTLEASGKKIFISNMEITLQNGEKLVLRYSASDAKPGQSASTRVLWSYGDTGKTYGSLESLDGSRIGSYQCNSQEIKGYIKTGGQLRVENKYNFSPAEMIFTGTSTDEHQLVSFEFAGSFPPIARVAFRSSTGDLKGKSLRFESIVKGHNKGAEYPIQNVAENNQYILPINPAFVPEPYYLNRFDEQYIQGIYHYQVMPMLDKPVAMFSKANANTPAAMGDFLQSIAIPVPKTQVLVFENRATKTNIGDKPPYRYKWDINLQIGDLKLTRKRPSDLQEEELFLKFCGPSADGYKGVLTTKKPENYLNPVVEKQQHEMDAYKLEAGECWCKLAYNTQRGGMFSDENLAYNEKQGSNKLKDLFLPKTVWFNASETEYNWNENGGPKADVRLLIFDSAMISWTVQKEGCSNNYQSLELRGDRTKKNYSEYLLKQNPQPVFVHDVPDLQLQTTNVLAIIQALQDRVKALEDAAPKPQYKLIVVIL